MTIEELRIQGQKLYNNGLLENALKTFIKLISHPKYEKKSSSKEKISDLTDISYCYYTLGNFSEALKYTEKIYKLNSKNYSSIINLAVSYYRTKDYENAIKYGLLAKEINPNDANLYSLFSELYPKIKEYEKAKEAGSIALILKEEALENYPAFDISKKETPILKNDASKNIISFSLFGSNPKYCECAVLNAKKALSLYENWTCRFYCSTDVPSEIIERLKKENAQVIIKETPKDIKEMLCWRFYVMSDKTIDRYLVRDCDSIINEKEAVAVKEWIESNKKFHIMRDWYSHTAIILAGMFGGVTTLFDNIEDMIKDFFKEPHTSRTHLDQDFLAKKIWPTIKNDVFIHDSYFKTNYSSKTFPNYTSQKEIFCVGTNEANSIINVKIPNSENKQMVKWSLYDENKNKICTYDTKLVNMQFTTELPDEYYAKIQNKEYSLSATAY